MTQLLSLPFEYKARRYKALVAMKRKLDYKEYRVTIMNGDLEKMMFGHHIILERDGRFVANQVSEDDNLQKLQEAIIQAFTAHYEALSIFREEKYCNN